MNTYAYPIRPTLAIGVVIKNKGNKILLVQEKHNKHYEKAKGVWGLPAGKLRWTEPIMEGLKREVREEIGVKVKPIALIGVYQYRRDNSQCLGLAFLAKLKEGKRIKYDHDEIQDVQWCDIQQVLNSNIKLRTGVKEVLEDFIANTTLPLKNVHFFYLRDT